jgi:hypothetical protein
MQKIKRFLSYVLLLSLCVGIVDIPGKDNIVLAEEQAEVTAEEQDENTVYYGKYFQNVVTNEKTLSKLTQATFTDNKTTINGTTYIQANGKYFSADPIEWIILDDSDGYYTLLSKKILENREFGSFWNESDLRTWLNDDFYKTAFSSKERKDIKTVTNTTMYWPYEDAYINRIDKQYVKTKDKVYLLDLDDIQNEKYGFAASTDESITRVAYCTQYADINEGSARWWIRGPAEWSYGNLKQKYITAAGEQWSWYYTYSYGVRPVIKVKKDSQYLSKTLSKEKVTYKTRKITGTYKDGATKKEITCKLNYNDNYFNRSAWNVNGSLAKLSMLASSAVYYKKYANALMKELEFDDYEYTSNKVTSKKNDRVSYMIGHKTLDSSTIIAVWVKGTSGNYEWVSNFNVGENAEVHAGFSKAEKELNKAVTQYIKEKGLSGNIKYWITGHSRGAAVANLFAKRMTDKLESGNTDVFAYTFATPNVSKNATSVGYRNIKNYINPGDFVTELPPSEWGYGRYGIDIVLTSSTKSEMESLFKKTTGVKYQGFTKKQKKSLLKAYLNYSGSSVASYYKARKVYIAERKYDYISPAEYCQNGLALALNNDTKVMLDGVAYVLKVSGGDDAAAVVTGKMFVDGQITNKFSHAHTQATYMSWLKAMYN